MGITPEDLPGDAGSNASLPFGEATQFRQANRAIQSAGSSPRNMPGMPQGQPGMQQPPPGPPAGGLAPPPPGPVQPAPPQSRGATGERLDPSNVFTQFNGDGLGPMARLEVWANHPSKPRVINMLVDRARGRRDATTQ